MLPGGLGRGRAAAPFAIALALLGPPLSGAPTNRLQVGGGTIEVSIGPDEPSVAEASLLRWVERCGRTVSSYFGRFPVDRVDLDVVTGRGGKIRNGTTWGGRRPRTRVFVGRATTERDFEADWLLTHEMVHLALPEMADEHHWIEEGLATYVESVARARIGWLEPKAMWLGLAEGLPQGLPRRGDGGLDGTRAWGRTYWGGALFWLLADVEIRENTGNRRGLEDALRGVLKAGGNITVSWPIERALDAGDRATGVKILRDLYARMGPAAMDVDLDALWKKLGVVRGAGEVTLDDRAPGAAIRRAITRSSGADSERTVGSARIAPP